MRLITSRLSQRDDIPRRTARRAVAAGLSVIALSACGITASAAPAPASQHKARLTSALSNEAHARKVAAELLASLQLPSGAVTTSTCPTSLSDYWGGDGGRAIDDHSCFLVPGNAPSVMSWIEGDAPAGANTQTGPSRLGSTKYHPTLWYQWTDTFTWPAPNGLFSEQVLVAPHRQAALRADSTVVWLPAKSKYDVVLPGAKAVTVVTIHTPFGGKPRPVTITTTSAREITAITKLVNAQDVTLRFIGNCPLETSTATVEIEFRSTSHSQPFADVVIHPECPWSVNVITGRHQGHDLTGSSELVALLQHFKLT